MDGYAVRRADVVTATDAQPVTLPVVGEIGAGQATLRAIAPGTAAKIMTGAPIPEGADAVVPYEWTDRGVARVRIDQAPEPGQHVRPAGGDVSAGDLLVEEGTVLGPRHLGLLASVGRATVLTRPPAARGHAVHRLRAARAGQELGHDSIYDGNSYLLAAAVLPRGRDPLPRRHRPRRARRVPRDPARPAGRAPTSSSPPAGSPRATTTSSRRRCAAGRSGSARSRCSPASRRGSG